MRELPTGTVTFLFTDIEGSTRLWEQHPAAMEAAVARHDAAAAAIIEQHHGTLVKHRGEGDSLFAVFARARDAVSAATALQQALISEPWPAETPLRVRMAIHTGSADLRDGDYYGAAVNRCARLRTAAHGGQILLSSATQGLVQDDLPPETSLRDLGMHRLRDVRRPVRIFQLLYASLPTDFPSLRSQRGSARRAPKVGVFAVLVLMLAVGGFALRDMLLQRSVDPLASYMLLVEFDSVRGITKGAAVRMAGIHIGEVQSVALNPRRRVFVKMRIVARHTIGPRDRITIATDELLRQPYIEIFPEHDSSPAPPGVRRGSSSPTPGVRQGTSPPMLPEKRAPR